jgi:hypothetical protein
MLRKEQLLQVVEPSMDKNFAGYNKQCDGRARDMLT